MKRREEINGKLWNSRTCTIHTGGITQCSLIRMKTDITEMSAIRYLILYVNIYRKNVKLTLICLLLHIHFWLLRIIRHSIIWIFHRINIVLLWCGAINECLRGKSWKNRWLIWIAILIIAMSEPWMILNPIVYSWIILQKQIQLKFPVLP